MLVKVINFFTSVPVSGLLPSPPPCTSSSSCSTSANSSTDSHSIANDIWWDILLYQTTNNKPSVYNSPFSTNPPVLLISLDGFRSEYFNRNLTPFLHSLGEWSNSWSIFIRHCVHACINFVCSWQWSESSVHEERVSNEYVPQSFQYSHGELICSVISLLHFRPIVYYMHPSVLVYAYICMCLNVAIQFCDR